MKTTRARTITGWRQVNNPAERGRPRLPPAAPSVAPIPDAANEPKPKDRWESEGGHLVGPVPAK